MNQRNAVEIENLTFKYSGAKEPALRDIDLTFREGEIALLIGPTGAGKSTLYTCLNGLVPHMVQGRMSGRVIIAGMDTARHSIPELAQKVGIVFQNPEVQIFSLTVRDELAFGPANLGLSKDEIFRRINSAVSIIQLADLLDREPARLSGGQQQTVALGSIWTMLPEVLILDEPTSNLDPQSSQRVLRLIEMLNRDYGKTILIAEHKIDEVAPFVDHVFVMHHGQIIADGTPTDVFSQVELLHSYGIYAPTPFELAYRLRQQGIHVPNVPLTIEDAIDTFADLLPKGLLQ